MLVAAVAVLARFVGLIRCIMRVPMVACMSVRMRMHYIPVPMLVRVRMSVVSALLGSRVSSWDLWSSVFSSKVPAGAGEASKPPPERDAELSRLDQVKVHVIDPGRRLARET